MFVPSRRLSIVSTMPRSCVSTKSLNPRHTERQEITSRHSQWLNIEIISSRGSRSRYDPERSSERELKTRCVVSLNYILHPKCNRKTQEEGCKWTLVGAGKLPVGDRRDTV
jgi:hypothetical protein